MRWLGTLLILAVANTAASQTASTWLTASDGVWGDAANWSTDPSAPSSPGFEAVIDASGVPYQVTIDSDVAPDRVSIDSADAQVVLAGGSLTATEGVWANAAPLVLQQGTVRNTRLAGAAGVVAQQAGASEVVLEDVTLATTLDGDGWSFDLTGDIVLEDALIIGDELGLDFNGDTRLSGRGEIRYSNGFARYISIEGDSPQIEIGEDVTLRSTAGTVYVWPANDQTGAELVTNRGTIEADGGTIVFDSRVSVANEGVFRAVNGGRLFINGVRSNRSVGALDFGTDGEIHFSGAYRLGQAIEVPEGSDLGLWGTWRVEAPVTVAGGAVVGLGGNTSVPGGGNWSWGDSAAVEIRTTFVRPSTLLNIETTPTTEIRFRYDGELDLDGQAFDPNDIPGVWNLSQAHFTDGTLTGLPNGGVIDSESDYVTLENIVLDTPLVVQAGFVVSRSSLALVRPVQVDGGELWLRDEWTNAGGVTVDGGRLRLDGLPADLTDLGVLVVRSGSIALPALPEDPSAIRFEGGDLEVGFSSTLTQLRSLSTAPATVTAGYSGANFPSGSIDLEGERFDVAGQPFALSLDGGTVRNGELWKSTDDGPWRIARGTLTDIHLQTDVEADSLTLNGATHADRVRLTGDVRVSGPTLLTGSTIDGRLEVWGDIRAQESLTIHGAIDLGTSRVRFEGGPAVLDGAGEMSTDGARGVPGGGVEVAQGSLTFGPDFTFHSRRNGSTIAVEAGDLINDGTIRAGVDGYGASFRDVNAPSITITLDEVSLFNGRIFQQNGLLQIEDGYEVRLNAATLANAGAIELQGGVLDVSPATLSSSGEIRGDGAILALSGGGFQNSGRLAPGDHAVTDADGVEVGDDRLGMLQLIGDYLESETATLAIDLAGSDPGAGYDRLVVSGAAELAGSLEVSFLNGYDPLSGQTFEILTAGSLEGEFSQVALPTLSGGRDWQIDYLATSVRLRVLGLPGDFNGDGVVTNEDLAAYHNEYGAVGVGLSADANHDGVVDAADYTVWRDAMASPPAAVVPEATAAMLFACVALTLIARSRKRP